MGYRRSKWGVIFFVTAALLLAGPTGYAQDGGDYDRSAFRSGAFSDTEVEFYEPPVVRDAARDVLDGPEFRNLPRLDLGPGGNRPEQLKSKKEEQQPRSVQVRAPSAGAEFFTNLFGGAVSLVVIAVLAAVLGGIVLLVVYGVRRWERSEKRESGNDADATSDDEQEPLVSPGEKPADAWLAAARSAALKGRFDEALALLLLGAMGHAERAGMIRPRRGLTYRDYLRAIPESSAWHPALEQLIRAYAPVGFGRREATAAAFDSVVAPYESALALEPAHATNASPTL